MREVTQMKKVLLGIILLASVVMVPLQTTAQIHIGFSIGLPPPIVFSRPPNVIVLPDTDYVYVIPDLDIDLYFWNGWWWRLWEGNWYRSPYYDSEWEYVGDVPDFYYDIDPNWRIYYRSHSWYGYPWNYELIAPQILIRNWRNWYNDRYWERGHPWGVRNYRPRPRIYRPAPRPPAPPPVPGPRIRPHIQGPGASPPPPPPPSVREPRTQPRAQGPGAAPLPQAGPRIRPQIQGPGGLSPTPAPAAPPTARHQIRPPATSPQKEFPPAGPQARRPMQGRPGQPSTLY